MTPPSTSNADEAASRETVERAGDSLQRYRTVVRSAITRKRSRNNPEPEVSTLRRRQPFGYLEGHTARTEFRWANRRKTWPTSDRHVRSAGRSRRAGMRDGPRHDGDLVYLSAQTFDGHVDIVGRLAHGLQTCIHSAKHVPDGRKQRFLFHRFKQGVAVSIVDAGGHGA